MDEKQAVEDFDASERLLTDSPLMRESPSKNPVKETCIRSDKPGAEFVDFGLI